MRAEPIRKRGGPTAPIRLRRDRSDRRCGQRGGRRRRPELFHRGKARTHPARPGLGYIQRRRRARHRRSHRPRRRPGRPRPHRQARRQGPSQRASPRHPQAQARRLRKPGDVVQIDACADPPMRFDKIAERVDAFQRLHNRRRLHGALVGRTRAQNLSTRRAND